MSSQHILPRIAFYLFIHSSLPTPLLPPILSCYSALRVLQLLYLQMFIEPEGPIILHPILPYHPAMNFFNDWMMQSLSLLCKEGGEHSKLWGINFFSRRIRLELGLSLKAHLCLTLFPSLPCISHSLLIFLLGTHIFTSWSASAEPHLWQSPAFNWTFTVTLSYSHNSLWSKCH